MLSTKNLVSRIEDIPSYWIFQYYLNIQEQLTGQDIKINSVFNHNDKTPSFCIYVDKSIMQYKFKDFSTGRSGSKIDLVMNLFNISFSDASIKIVDDYNQAMKNGKVEFRTLKPEVKWQIDYVQTRNWNDVDAKFWLSFNIGSSLLKEYNVKALDYYTMIKDKPDGSEKMTFKKPNTYGYFNKDNKLIKIYQPLSSKHKFYNALDYMQAFDQLTYTQPYLVICSSLKDAMCLRSFKYNLEVLAPSSENSMIKPYVINNLKSKYKKVITLFDNDEAGKNAIDKYAKAYNVQGCALSICKDISDAVKKYGFDKVHAELKPLLKETLNK